MKVDLIDDDCAGCPECRLFAIYDAVEKSTTEGEVDDDAEQAFVAV